MTKVELVAATAERDDAAAEQKRLRVVPADELAKHRTSETGYWLAIDGRVYDVSRFAKRHPGGERLMLFFAGQDASDAFHSFHILPERSYVLMDAMCVGRLADSGDVDCSSAKLAAASSINRLAGGKASSKLSLLDDFRLLRQQLHDEGLFEANVSFFMSWFAHVVALELAAGLVAHSGVGSTLARFALCAVLLAVAQVQAGWLQHDFGHLSVFKSIGANDLWHKITIMLLKGASATWWKTRHNRHHAKTNVLGADPDVDNDPLFVIGERMAASRRGWWLSRFQHLYWFVLGPPLVTTLLFVYQNVKFVQQRRLHEEKLWIVAFFARLGLVYVPAFGALGALALYFAMRLIESMWFTWITSMSHLPMQIETDDEGDWLSHTLATTQNLAPGTLNNWITGHLNYQVEHHLFPTMPRHNYAVVAPRVAALCARHKLAFRTRTLWEAAWDIVAALRVTANQLATKSDAKSRSAKAQ